MLELLRWCVSITSNRYFDYVIGIIILINSLLVGAEVELSLQGIVLPWMQPLDTAFIMVYCIEIGMRLVGSGWRACFADGWFLLDFVLVVVGVITTLALQFPGLQPMYTVSILTVLDFCGVFLETESPTLRIFNKL